MSIKRSEKRKDTVSSEENDDNEEAYAKISFQVDFPTKEDETIYILGNIEELGNWDKEKAEKLMKLDESTNIWESSFPLNCPVGMTIRYKYLIVDSNNNKTLENLPNNEERVITTKKPGQYIIMNKKDDPIPRISFLGNVNRSLKRKMSRITYDVLSKSSLSVEVDGENTGNEKDIKNLKFNFKKEENEGESEYISYLSPKDLISYENNISNFEIYDKIPDFD